MYSSCHLNTILYQDETALHETTAGTGKVQDETEKSRCA